MDGASRATRANGGGIPTPLEGHATADGLWQFCLYHYDQREVKDACFKLQEKHKGNANLALMLAWLEHCGFSLSASSLSALRDVIQHSDGLIRRYRVMRRELKPQLSVGAYQKMLNYELMLEKHQQQLLVTCLNEQTWLRFGVSTLHLYLKQLDPIAGTLYFPLMKGLNIFMS